MRSKNTKAKETSKPPLNLSAMNQHVKKDGCEVYSCPTCNHQVSVRIEEFDVQKASSLRWLWDAYQRYGITKIPCTLAAAKKCQTKRGGQVAIPDYVHQHRVYCKLKYWGLVLECPKQGYWALTERAREVCINGLKIPKYVFVLEDQRIGESDQMISLEEAEWEETTND